MSMEHKVYLEHCCGNQGSAALRHRHRHPLWRTGHSVARAGAPRARPSGLRRRNGQIKLSVCPQAGTETKGPRFSWPWPGLACKWDSSTRWLGRQLVPRRYLWSNVIWEGAHREIPLSGTTTITGVKRRMKKRERKYLLFTE